MVITLHILEIFTVTVNISPDVCVKKALRSPRRDTEQHMINSELNMLLLAKCEMYMFIFHMYCIYLLCTIMCMLNKQK